MRRIHLFALLFGLIASAGIVYFGAMGGKFWFTMNSKLPLLGLAVFTPLAGLVELAKPGAPPQRRIRRLRSLLFAWMGALACDEVMMEFDLSGVDDLRQHVTLTELGVVEGLNFLYYAFFVDFALLRPAEIWFGPPPAPTPP
jgi:hypothetical protein